jgi:PepB aminopeptidase
MTTSVQAKIYLNNQSNQTNSWQEKNLVQIHQDNINIFITADELFPLRKIQEAARKIAGFNLEQATLAGDNWQEAEQWAFALGFTGVGKLQAVNFTGDEALVSKLTRKLAVYAWSRDLINQTPSQLFPERLANLAAEFIKEKAPDCVNVTVIKGDDLLKQGWTGIYNVGKGSQHAPCLVEIDYNPSKDEQTSVSASVVGKGITFDSGGYSIKSNAGMFDMKGDMGGAAVVSGALALAIEQGLSKRVKLFLCCAENMISGNAYKLGDIITYKNGVTVEVANTDAEGRLVLADGLIAASETKAPLIINAATLTGAAVMATGGDYTALFSLDQPLVEKAKACAEKVTEAVWQLPLARWHQTKCPSAFADTANSRPVPGGGAGGASNAAGFLSRFVANDGKGWLHFDLAADYNSTENAMWAAGATGQGIATIAELLLTQ